MKDLLNPRWLFLINTLPIAVLFFLLYGQFSIIKTMLNEENIYYWKYFTLTLGGFGCLNFLYAFYLTVKEEKVSVIYGVIALVSYIPFIYFYSYSINYIIPSSVPRWMVSEASFVYVGTFLMPTLAYALFLLVVYFTPKGKNYHAGWNFLGAISVPVLGYIFIQIILPLWKHFDNGFIEHSFIVLSLTGAIIFLFFLIRSVYIMVVNKDFEVYQLPLKIVIGILFPVLGLLLNNDVFFEGMRNDVAGIFGNFSNPWFYVIAVVNGGLVCLPDLDNKPYRLALYVGRSITFAYTLYFFIVFLPFLPLSVVAVIAIGTGFLMLTPLLLFVIHINILVHDFDYLKKEYSKVMLWTIALIGFLCIPAFVTESYLKDKRVLTETLDYLYSPDYSKEYKIDKKSLKKTLRFVVQQKDRFGGGFFGQGTPYLSSYFNWLVLDNLTLSDAKIGKIERLFFDKTKIPVLNPAIIRNPGVNITNVKSKSTYDEAQKAWRSWVDLEMTNASGFNNQEYATTIDLPEGTWISDYYLYDGERKEPGILSEKKAAMWIFSQIRNERKDPGILYYLTGNRVAFRVFPFLKDEVRKTGIEFLHKDPIRLTIDGNTLDLGDNTEVSTEIIETESMIYVPAQQKASLTKVERQSYLHFIVDVSAKGKDNLIRLENLIEANKHHLANAKITMTNTYCNTIPLDENWKEIYNRQPFEGGFYLDRAIRQTLFKAYQENVYPMIVVVTDNMQRAIVEKDFADWQFVFPESDLFYVVDEGGLLNAHSLTGNPKKASSRVVEWMSPHTVLKYKSNDGSFIYLPDDNQSSVFLKKGGENASNFKVKEKNWRSALEMQGSWYRQILHPEKSNKEWLDLVANSFKSKVMTPLTAYIVVETEAQKVVLKRKQEQALSGNKNLDLGEDVDRMSEPSFVLVIALLLGILWYRRKGQKSITA